MVRKLGVTDSLPCTGNDTRLSFRRSYRGFCWHVLFRRRCDSALKHDSPLVATKLAGCCLLLTTYLLKLKETRFVRITASLRLSKH